MDEGCFKGCLQDVREANCRNPDPQKGLGFRGAGFRVQGLGSLTLNADPQTGHSPVACPLEGGGTPNPKPIDL